MHLLSARGALISLLFVILAGCTDQKPPKITTPIPVSTSPTLPPTPTRVTSNTPLPTSTKTPEPPTLTSSPPATPTVTPQPEVNVELVGQIGGESKALAVQGQYTYLGVGPRLVVLDTSNPRAPRAVGQSDVLPGVVSGVVLINSRAYLATARVGDGRGYLLVLSLADPSQPQLLGSLDLQSPALGLAVNQGYAYVASGTAGLRIIDVSDPEALRQVGLAATGQKVTAVAVAGQYVYVTEDKSSETSLSGALQIIDVVNPAAPQVVGSLELTYFAQAITIRDDYAYLASAGLNVVDISDSAHPRQVGFHQEGPFYDDVAVADGYAFISTDQYCDVIAVCPRQVGIVDVTDPTRPKGWDYRTKGIHWSGLGTGRGLAAWNGLVYVATEDGLHVLDIATWPPVGEYTPVTLVADVAVSNGHAYTIDNHNELHVIDVHDPVNPTNTGALAVDMPDGVAVSNDYAFLSLWEYGLIMSVDIRNPASPREVGSLKTNEIIQAMTAVEGYVYAVTSVWEEGKKSRLLVVDMTNPARPHEIGSLVLSGSGFMKIVIENGYAYIGSQGRLEVVDLTDPAAPRLVSEFIVGPADPGYGWSMTVAGTYAYFVRSGVYQVELLVIDLTDPARPAQITTLPLSRGGSDVAVAASYVYVSGFGGLSVVDISNPVQPREVGISEFGSGKIVVDGDYLYVAGWSAGLWILRVTPLPLDGS